MYTNLYLQIAEWRFYHFIVKPQLGGIFLRIDFHMHLFPDKLAQRALSSIASATIHQPYTDATIAGTLSAMKTDHINYGVVLHIATNARQQTAVNNFAYQVQTEYPSLFSFGSVFPASPDAQDELQRIKSLGLYGVKLHPAYQHFMADDKLVYPIYETIQAIGLPLTFHAGWDPVEPQQNFASPKQLATVAKAFPSLTIIAAHLGGFDAYEETIALLAPLPNVLLDTALCGKMLANDKETYLRVIRAFGAERILFASDCPWNGPQNEYELLCQIGLTADEMDLVLWKNAYGLLGLNAEKPLQP